ncbi:AIR synthase related protein [Pseudonocardia hydrocarbonoxydans]|uniref:Methanogenesis marker 2 protein n=1 Tax=Pseudonocardia hydrocarbonoxydans TaxID=76726 RepID=A0A4Y3WHS1_9PSEU|nr:AIR synthase related protein [Pseudonocardia hydrocarbonoxydans]GEC17751.1 methanogenesis marker 2 protein [Pseudonocardia hydrocarbonoxydans]
MLAPRTDQAALEDLVERLRAHPGLRGKAAIGLVSEVLGASDWLGGPGDDGAVVEAFGGSVVACGEAMWPPFVRADPFGAGFAAVLTNVNDLAAMGAVPLGIVDTIVADAATARRVLEGMRRACALLRVPVVGGHLTEHDGEPAVSAFGVGAATHPLSVTRMAAGQVLVAAYALDGTMRPDFPFFPAFDARGERCAGDVRLLAEVAAAGSCVAAKDISMAGFAGSLAMLLEQGRFGVTVDLGALPVPDGVDLAAWLTCFPSFGFLLCAPAGREDELVAAFTGRGLHAAALGVLDDSGRLDLRLGQARATVFDVGADAVTGLAR